MSCNKEARGCPLAAAEWAIPCTECLTLLAEKRLAESQAIPIMTGLPALLQQLRDAHMLAA